MSEVIADSARRDVIEEQNESIDIEKWERALTDVVAGGRDAEKGGAEDASDWMIEQVGGDDDENQFRSQIGENDVSNGDS